MLATAMSLLGSPSVLVAVTQSIPQRMPLMVPAPVLLSTRTDHRFAPGATPTMPTLLSLAPRMPVTSVPWPEASSKLCPLAQPTPPTTFRSGLVASMPVSITATLILTDPLPSPDLVLLRSAAIRCAQFGRHCRDEAGLICAQ